MTTNPASRRVLRTYLGLSGLYTLSASLSWGVNTLFLLDAGLDIFETFVANAAFTAAMVLFEIPTGVFADTRGRRFSFLTSVVVLALGTAAYLAAAETGAGLAAFCAASVVLGLGFTFYSGAVDAWLVDALSSTGYRGGLDRVFARGQMVTGIAMLIGTVTGGVLGSIDLSLPLVARMAMLVPVFALAFVSMKDLAFEARALEPGAIPRELRRLARAGIAHGWRRPPIRWLMIMGFVRYSFLMWAFYAWQPYFLELLGRDAVWVAGVVSALMSLAMIAGNGVVDYLSRYCGRRTTLLLWAAAVQTVAAVGVGLAGSFWLALALFLLMMAASGVITPVHQAYLNRCVPSRQRATVISFDSMFQNGGGILGQTGLGILARQRGIGYGYLAGGLATALVIPILMVVRRLDGPADVIVGDKGGADGLCAAQGLPSIAAVDATPPAES